MSEHGSTVREIEDLGFEIATRVNAPTDGRSGTMMAKALGAVIIGLSDAFEQLRPDIVVVLGDRGEMLAGALAAIHQNIIVAHIHGGERSGTVDESLRHAISKLAHYHFVSTDASRTRLVKMGEIPNQVFVTGAPSLDDLVASQNPTRAELWKSVEFDPNQETAIVVFHPVIQEVEQMGRQMQHLMQAVLDHGLQALCLLPNSDAGGASIKTVLEDIARKHRDVRVFAHLPRHQFISWMARADVMIGNSSSGIIEAATLGLAVVNVGTRQRNRERSANVVDADAEPESIYAAIEKALQMEGPWRNVYGDGGASERIANLLSGLPLDCALLNKSNAY